MKGLVFLSLVFSINVFACPDLTGVFECPEDEGVSRVEVQRVLENGIYSYLITDEDGVTTFKADGKAYDYVEEGLEGAKSVTTCAAKAVLVDINGIHQDKAYNAAINSSLENNNLVIRTDVTWGGDVFPTDTEVCKRAL